MAKFKKTAKTSTRKDTPGKADARAQAERLSKSLSESAQQIWLAGVGAFGRAQEEGTRLFEGLVKEGQTLEKTARTVASSGAESVRGAMETGVGQARERATDTWDRLEKVFEDRVQRALVQLGMPGRDDLRDLSGRVDTLTRELRRQGTGATSRTATSMRPAPAKTAARAAADGATTGATATQAKAKRATVKKTVAKKSPASKTAARKTGTSKPRRRVPAGERAPGA